MFIVQGIVIVDDEDVDDADAACTLVALFFRTWAEEEVVA